MSIYTALIFLGTSVKCFMNFSSSFIIFMGNFPTLIACWWYLMLTEYKLCSELLSLSGDQDLLFVTSSSEYKCFLPYNWCQKHKISKKLCLEKPKRWTMSKTIVMFKTQLPGCGLHNAIQRLKCITLQNWIVYYWNEYLLHILRLKRYN
jgi:hypothetical protein